jgi:hypothetical protein|tara:strand:+ start:875 stop:1066 length:192 start_codon:yes stop_codon:yes gene_type:complete
MEASFKDKCRIFYMVKGGLKNTNVATIEDCYEGYFKRLWGNHEATYREIGFEEHYKEFSESLK